MYTALLVLGSDVIYSEGAVLDLLDTLLQLCGNRTTIFLAGELRNGKFLDLFFCVLAHVRRVLKFLTLLLQILF